MKIERQGSIREGKKAINSVINKVRTKGRKKRNYGNKLTGREKAKEERKIITYELFS